MADLGGADAPVSRTRVWPAVVAVLALSAVLGSLVALIATRSAADGPAVPDEHSPRLEVAEVQLEPVTYRSPAPFAESVVTADDAELQSLVLSAPLDMTGGAVLGDTSRLYATRDRPVCDLNALAQRITADSAVQNAWAQAAGVDPAAVASTVASLTPVVLRADTAVTNHIYGPDGARPLQSILQAGTPVLIDAHGAPRVQCSCGNPLRPAQTPVRRELVGERWDGLDESDVVEVTPAPDPLDDVDTVDIDTGDDTLSTLSGNVLVDGYLAQHSEGVDVVDEEGSTTPLLDRPVETVVDDGAGGVLFTLRRDDADEFGLVDGPPPQRDRAVVWHLPAGRSEAVELIRPKSDAEWNVLLAAGRLGDRRYAIYSPLRADGAEVYERTPTGPIVARDLDSGDDRVISEFGFGWETHTGSITFGANLLSMEHGYASPDWQVLDPEFRPVPVACSSADMDEADDALWAEYHCPWSAVLDESGNLAFLSSQLDRHVTVESLETMRLDDGSPVSTTELDLIGPGQESASNVVQATADRVVTQLLAELREYYSGAVFDRHTGAQIELPAGPDGSTSRYWKLTAPLLRPVSAAGTAKPPTSSPHRSEAPDLDVMNAELPAAICDPDGLDDRRVQLSDGSGTTTDDLTSDDYLSIELEPQRVAKVDMDGDHEDEIVVAPLCRWGGKMYTTPLTTLSADGGGQLILDSRGISRFDDGEQAIASLEALDGAVAASGDEWADGDDLCCPSGSFRSVWRMVDGSWEER